MCPSLVCRPRARCASHPVPRHLLARADDIRLGVCTFLTLRRSPGSTHTHSVNALRTRVTLLIESPVVIIVVDRRLMVYLPAAGIRFGVRLASTQTSTGRPPPSV